MPSFDTAVARATETEELEYNHEFDINERDDDDRIVRTVKCWFREPDTGEIVMLLTDTQGRRANLSQRLAALVDFMTEVLDEPSQEYVVQRMLDPKDAFGLEDLTPILEWMIEEFGGRPTRQPSDYLPSRKTAGRSSTQRTSKSTSSRSRSTASSTPRTPTS